MHQVACTRTIAIFHLWLRNNFFDLRLFSIKRKKSTKIYPSKQLISVYNWCVTIIMPANVWNEFHFHSGGHHFTIIFNKAIIWLQALLLICLYTLFKSIEILHIQIRLSVVDAGSCFLSSSFVFITTHIVVVIQNVFETL